ncbi:hypothetical protein Tco_0083593 [Tanacetum coccineum]
MSTNHLDFNWQQISFSKGLPPTSLCFRLAFIKFDQKELEKNSNFPHARNFIDETRKRVLIVPVFQKGDDPIDAINHMMSFLTAVEQVEAILGNKGLLFVRTAKGEGHMSKQCSKPKRKQDDSWFKDKVLLVQAQASGQILHEEEPAFLANPGIPECDVVSEQYKCCETTSKKKKIPV